MTGEFEAVVVDIREERRIEGRTRWQVQLDRTEFRVGDAGELRARSKSGTVLVVPVLGVSQGEAGESWHAVEKPLGTGTAVTGLVTSGRAARDR